MDSRSYASKPITLFIALSLSICLIASLIAQEKTVRSSHLACPVTANLFPEQVRNIDSIRFIFPENSKPKRISMALIDPENNEVPVKYKWVGIDDHWGVQTGIFIANGEGKTDCFFLEAETDIPANVPCKEFVLDIPEGILVKEISFSSLPSEKPQMLCPMPELERQIKQAIEDCSRSPQDKNKALLLIQLLDKATPTYDCRRSYDTRPVPAWWLADHEAPWRWVDYLYDRILENNDDALRVYQKFLASSDGAYAEVWSEEMWEILSNKPLLVLENWTGIENSRGWVLVARPGPTEGYSRVNEVIEIYRDISIKEPKYKSACDEIIGILSDRIPLMESGGRGVQEPPPSQTTSVDTVKKLTAEIDQYVKDNQESNQKLIARRNPVDRSSPGDSWQWKRIENWDEANDYFKGYWSYLQVAVWAKDSKVTFVETSEWSDSGDWAIYINYYFDDRGRLLHISTDFRTHIDKLKILDFQYFDESGQILDHTVDYYALGEKTSQKLSVDPENMEQPIHEIPVYLSVSELPFYGLIHLDRKSTGLVKCSTDKPTAR